MQIETNVSTTLNSINDKFKMTLVTANKYFTMVATSINLNPVYQRPYTYFDKQKNYWGCKWQKDLIVSFLTGEFIQPIHLLSRKTGKFSHWIIDGGHRTRTLYNFLQGYIKTPKGFVLEYLGQSYDIGEMTWIEIVQKHSDLKTLLDDLTILYFEHETTSKEARKIFIKLNKLHNMTDAEMRNAFDALLADMHRDLGSVDSKKSFPIFTEYKQDGNLVHIGTKAVKRVTDEIVTIISWYLYSGGYDNLKNYTSPTAATLMGWYELSEESDTINNKFKSSSTYYKRLKSLIGKLNDLVLTSDRKRSQWKKMSLLKVAILLDWFYSKNNYKFDEFDIDWKTFNKQIDIIHAKVKDVHYPYSRYNVVGNKVKTISKINNDESYTMNSVFTSGNRVDDIEFWLYNIITRFNESDFGITKVDKQKRTFTDKQKSSNFTGKCEECDKDITLSESRADHILPHSRGGKTNTDNLQLLCNDCNTDKSSGVTSEDLIKVLTNYSGRIDADKVKKLTEVLNS